MSDIAEAAQVSLATVDRVLNRRKGVKTRTVRRVLDTALALGYVSAAEHARLSRPRPPNVVFLLPMGGNPYLRLLGDRVRAVAQSKSRDEAQVRCFFIESFDAKALAGAIRHHAAWADGIAFMAIDHPLVREAVEEVSASGRRIVTIISDLQHSLRDAYVGLDNQAAGRTAGYLLGRFCRARTGSVALVAGSRNYRAHAEREMGFLGLLEETYPGLRVVGMREGHDDREENYRHAMSLLEQNADLAGIYNVGGSSDGIGRALREKGRSDDIVFIGHGLTGDTRRLLIEGIIDAVINSDPDMLLASALRIFEDLQRGDIANPAALPPVKMDIIFRENLPPALSVGGGPASRGIRRPS
ncbi:LacI family DNA-binding transcriptional regulator [Chelativorans sp. M5D2P16]|uniref:LacI family DNA-binding transcriptional regulator n=1 Tax=Chelativorans sp. M5D2P16 TaxID=3095678 RepID=UPI002ACA0A42|nr:LacI family DNA-binding transcriptional regulator [Chelativorans sp. M5D2P16]MDZ5699636.1 LacI family DNA-binding transcriptional regulator [Chelativorans sp. M5D2P16]